jgi:hypothetical protein
VQGSIGVGFVARRPNLAPSDKATFESMQSALRDDSNVLQEKAERAGKKN